MMETQFTGGELVKHGVRVETCVLGDLLYPFGSAFELSEVCFCLSNLVLPKCARLFTCGPGGTFLFDCSKLCGLALDGGLERSLQGVDLLGFGLGMERQFGVVLQRKLFRA